MSFIKFLNKNIKKKNKISIKNFVEFTSIFLTVYNQQDYHKNVQKLFVSLLKLQIFCIRQCNFFFGTSCLVKKIVENVCKSKRILQTE